MVHINIEIKAACVDHDRVRDILRSKNAIHKGVDHQIDTYFRVNSGRLKLREGNIENHLIHYVRENTVGPKRSDITLFASHPDTSLKEILTKACGILIVVDKKRDIYFIDNVKFHIDVVQDLGTFVEIEAIDDGSIGSERLLEQCRQYMVLFDIHDEDVINVSYSDLLMQKNE